MIEIWEPRYRDKKVLVACYKIPSGKGVEVKICKGAYKGVYEVSHETVISAPIERMNTRRGGSIEIRAIPLAKLTRKATNND